MNRDVFYSVAAQPDNLGDIAIRQVPLDWAADTDHRFIIYTGRMPAEYVEAIDLPADTILIDDGRRFAVRFLLAIVSRRADLIFAPGPVQLRAGVRPLVKGIGNFTMICLVRASGGRVVALGRAIRGQARVARFVERMSVRRMHLFVTRDLTSSKFLGLQLRSAPDLALARPGVASESGNRPYVAISLRSDRHVNDDLLSAVILSVREAGMSPVLVTQVKRDDPGHEQLAAQHGVLLCSWTSQTHRDQLARVNDIYSQSQAVVSDRLHALIFGVNNGAVPIGLEHAGNDKLPSTLRDLLPLHLQDPSMSTLSTGLDSMWTEKRRLEIVHAVGEARISLSSLRAEVANLLR